MRITELLKRESIELGVALSSKEDAIDRLTGLMEAGGRLYNRAGYKEGILAREAQGSTAVGDGIAIPHAKVAAVKEPGLAAVTVPEGVDYDAFDGSLAHLVFMIAAPAEGADVHLEALARLSTLLMMPGFKDNLIGAADKDAFLRIIDEAERARYGDEEGNGGGSGSDESGSVVGKDVRGAHRPKSGGAGQGTESGKDAEFRLLAVTA